MTQQRTAGRHAVVIGAGLAGMLAAWVLREHAGRVTVIERDRAPEGPKPRAGVPQGRHAHVLLPSGQRALDALLPGTVDRLLNDGARQVGMPEDMVQWQAGRWYLRTPASIHLLACTRPLIDWTVRERVRSDDRIHFTQSTEAAALLGDAGRVRGVRVRGRGAGDRATRDIEADLVIDASGRSSASPLWLNEIGARAPREESIDTGLAYASQVFRAPEGEPDPAFHCFYVLPNAAQPLTAVLLRVEEGRWIASLSGPRGLEPPTDAEGFVDYASRYPHPHLRDWLSKAVAESPVVGGRHNANVRRYYEERGRLPAGFLAMGDALCAFNPIYGQGMSVAALGAVALRAALSDRDSVPTTARTQRALAAVARQAWEIAAGADKEIPGVEFYGTARGATADAAAWYLRRLQQRVPGNPTLGAAYRDVLALNAPLTTLFAPRNAADVLFTRVPATPEHPPLTRDSLD
ncbi:FAD-dependent oxidoreductase [Streptomyces tsukubensis]|uniref:FAD-dependent oxidoreductase n=1 Tax=Streptomyces tsukubensis TaxID=83656 RepID=UPI001D04011E|nr:FAD-binding protein [Streptomyces tsukubensis]